MRKIILRTFIAALLSVTFFQCNNNAITNTAKLQPNDPFKNTIVESQFFDIDSKQDNVIEGKNGTVIICPKGCFKNAKGEIVDDNIKIELSEALSLEDMLLSNLTTTSDGRQLETDGMIYFNATANGEQITINKENPVHIEIPTTEKKAGMMAYRGIRDEKGNMNWIEPKALDNYLVTVDINSLDFLPQGFQTEVDKGMPYKKYKTATQGLTDSLYYNLSVTDGSELRQGLVNININEQDNSISEVLQPVKWSYSKEKINTNEYDIIIKATIEKGWILFAKESNKGGPLPLDIFFNPGKSYKLVGTLKNKKPDIKYDPGFKMNLSYYSNEVEFRQRIKLLDKSAIVTPSIEFMTCDNKQCLPPISEKASIKIGESCGIDPAIIKVIKSEKYQNTFIATREFEKRLKVIFKTCNNEVLETYINNLDKNLYEVDSMATIAVGEGEYHQDFVNFSQQRLTKVKHADKYADLLKGYYEKLLAKVKSELEKAQIKVIKELNEKNEEVQKVADDYKKLLWKREKYRMETYGFNWTKTGWINIDNGTLPKEWYKQPLEITIANGKQFDRVYTYVVYTSIKSLYRLNTTDNEQFYVGNTENKQMLMPKKKLGVAIAIGYKDEVPSLSVKEFETGSEPKFSLTLSPSSIDKVKEAIRSYEKYAKENKISKDLEFMAKFYKEEQRQKELKKESEFILGLWNIAFPCCAVHGDSLYMKTNNQ